MSEQRKLDLPDRRKNTYDDLVDRLNKYTAAVERRLHRFFMKTLFVFAIIGITSAVALFGFGIVLSRLADTRRTFVRDTCHAQNDRHDKTIAALRKTAKDKRLRDPGVSQSEAQLRLTATIKLIDALAPKQDCNKLAQVSTGDAKPPPPDITTTPDHSINEESP